MLACPQGYVRVFADEGPLMAALLARLIAAQRTDRAAARVPLGCLARLHRAPSAQDIVPDARRGGVTAVPGPVEPLTSRELEVLAMLAAGRSNQAIARELVVTLDRSSPQSASDQPVICAVTWWATLSGGIARSHVDRSI